MLQMRRLHADSLVFGEVQVKFWSSPVIKSVSPENNPFIVGLMGCLDGGRFSCMTPDLQWNVFRGTGVQENPTSGHGRSRASRAAEARFWRTAEMEASQWCSGSALACNAAFTYAWATLLSRGILILFPPSKLHGLPHSWGSEWFNTRADGGEEGANVRAASTFIPAAAPFSLHMKPQKSCTLLFSRSSQQRSCRENQESLEDQEDQVLFTLKRSLFDLSSSVICDVKTFTRLSWVNNEDSCFDTSSSHDLWGLQREAMRIHVSKDQIFRRNLF